MKPLRKWYEKVYEVAGGHNGDRNAALHDLARQLRNNDALARSFVRDMGLYCLRRIEQDGFQEWGAVMGSGHCVGDHQQQTATPSPRPSPAPEDHNESKWSRGYSAILTMVSVGEGVRKPLGELVREDTGRKIGLYQRTKEAYARKERVWLMVHNELREGEKLKDAIGRLPAHVLKALAGEIGVPVEQLRDHYATAA